MKLRRRFKVTTDSNHDVPVYPNILQRNLRTIDPNVAWVSDITYVPDEGRLVVCIFLDLFSRTSSAGRCRREQGLRSTLKTEMIHRYRYETRDLARRDIFEFIEGFYNRERLHSALGYRTPCEFERAAP